MNSLLAPLEPLADRSGHFLSKSSLGPFDIEGRPYSLPRYVFLGPQGGGERIRLGLFAGLHGDEPEGAYALRRFLALLEAQPDLARGYCLFIYPLCNPTGFEDKTRCSRRGFDLNREFWKNSREPEVALLENELRTHAFHGIVSLHTDDTSHGVYGYASGATFTENLLKPALAAAGELLPLNLEATIDGFNASQSIIYDCYEGVLCAPPTVRPRPFEIILESPQAAPESLKEGALVLALQTVLDEYRKLLAFAANL